MIKRGRGAFVDATERRQTGLHQGELDLLKTMMANFTHKATSAEWANKLTLPEHKISGFLSYLKGMDLIKSSSDPITLTDEEITQCQQLSKVGHYWIGGVGTPIHNRAKYAIENRMLTDILDERMDWDLNLFPLRAEEVITLKADFLRLDSTEVTLDVPTMTGSQGVQLMKLLKQKEVMVTIETL